MTTTSHAGAGTRARALAFLAAIIERFVGATRLGAKASRLGRAAPVAPGMRPDHPLSTIQPIAALCGLATAGLIARRRARPEPVPA